MDKFWIEYEQKEWTAEVGGVSSGVEGISIGYETKRNKGSNVKVKFKLRKTITFHFRKFCDNGP